MFLSLSKFVDLMTDVLLQVVSIASFPSAFTFPSTLITSFFDTDYPDCPVFVKCLSRRTSIFFTVDLEVSAAVPTVSFFWFFIASKALDFLIIFSWYIIFSSSVRYNYRSRLVLPSLRLSDIEFIFWAWSLKMPEVFFTLLLECGGDKGSLGVQGAALPMIKMPSFFSGSIFTLFGGLSRLSFSAVAVFCCLSYSTCPPYLS